MSEGRRYHLPPEYRPSPINETLDVSGTEYWNRKRVGGSGRYQWAAYEYARELARRAEARTIVDIGCGVATKLAALFAGEFDVFGVDQPTAVDACRRLGRPGTYVAENFEAPTFSVLDVVSSVDMVICSDVIEHLLDPDALLEYVRRLAGPNTIIVITTPDRNALHGGGNLAPTNPAHVREWERDEFRRYLEASGFQIQEQRLMLPFRMRPDLMTLAYVGRRLLKRLPLRFNQVVVARVVS